MASQYQEKQREHQSQLISNENIFENAKAGKMFRTHPRAFILEEGEYNLFKPIREGAQTYFKQNHIDWWGGYSVSGHILSSQIACLNHLFPLRNDPEQLLTLINFVTHKNFKELLPIPETLDVKEQEPHYIAFEAVSVDDHLNESKKGKKLTRGANCTSVDALIIAKDKNDEVYLLPIEWKYTEFYNRNDKSTEDRDREPKGTNGRGRERMCRYCNDNDKQNLIHLSLQLKDPKQYKGSIYFQEPFYQLMRQTLWVEQVIKNESSKWYGATKFLHLHFVPKANKDLLNKNYRNFPWMNGLCESWKMQLNHPDLYLCIDPKDFEEPIKDIYPNLYTYLQSRYWN